MDSYLFENKNVARYALGATCCALRNWLLAMTENPPKNLMTRLTIPGVGALRVAWYGYDGRFAPKIVVRFSPTSKVRQQEEGLRTIRNAGTAKIKETVVSCSHKPES